MSINAMPKHNNVYQKINKQSRKMLPKVQISKPLQNTNKENINSNKNVVPLLKQTSKANQIIKPVEKDFSLVEISNEEMLFPLNTSHSFSSSFETELKSEEYNSINLSNFLTNISLSNKFSFTKYQKFSMQQLRDDYENDILDNLFSEEKCNEDFLHSHTITERMRSRMVDWMIEVLSNYKCSEETYFTAVTIMDNYFKKCKSTLKPEDLHLIGVTCMFIASKYQDVYPLRLYVLYDKIAHRKLTCEQIKKEEEKISKLLKYEFTFPSILDFINIFIDNMFTFKRYTMPYNGNEITSESIFEDKDEMKDLLESLYNEELVSLLKLVCIYIAKMNCYDCKLIGKKPSILAAASIFVSLKICEQIKKENYISDYFISKLTDISKYSEEDIIQYAQIILKNAQEFDTLFPNLDNLKRIHFNAILQFTKK